MASPFDLNASLDRAQQRLGSRPALRKKRSDYGSFRLDAAVTDQLRQLLAGETYPGGRRLLRDLRHSCEDQGLRCPSRATLYKFMQRDPGQAYDIASLPAAVREALYNLSTTGAVPGTQLVFYCFNYGELEAVHFASGLPWLPLYQAHRMRGWRPSCRGLLRAVLKVRRIPHG